ncbi:MAG: hypothetical protein SGJ20_08295, partial [Planctomycetota bacterium]|nr:hypothetical protein [Planctomycetota bacterium]
MNLGNVKLIMMRELRDQLRDRRTLFMIFVLPLLLYPLLGISFFQVAQFMREHPTNVLIVGLPELADFPPLVSEDQISKKWTGDTAGRGLLRVKQKALNLTDSTSEAAIKAAAQAAMRDEQVEVVIYFPPTFAQELQSLRKQILPNAAGERPERRLIDIPKPIVFFNTADEKSQVGYVRINEVLRSWIDAVGQQILSDGD